jgi:molybdopterin converting factor small subunit
VKVHVGSILYEYTKGRPTVEARGGTIAELFDDLERRFPGLRFRVIDERGEVRAHMKVFVNGELTKGLGRRLAQGDEVHILGALSGG